MRHTILLADDSLTIQRLVTQTFAGGKFDVVAVSNGDAAIKKFDEISPSIVLADIYMPGKNGYEVCHYVKNHATRKATPVVFLVGAFDAFDEWSSKEIGAAASITKPFEPQALINLVTNLLDGKPIEGPTEEVSPNGTHQSGPPHEVQAPMESDFPRESTAQAMPAPGKGEHALRVEPAKPLEQAPVPVDTSADDLLGLESIFTPPVAAPAARPNITEEEIERIADRVIMRLSTEVMERIAWDIVPDVAEKVVREEFKRVHES